MAAIVHIIHSIANIIKIDFVMNFSSLENFCYEPIELRMIRVSCPVYTTTPIIHSELRKLEPLKSMFSCDSETFCPS